ncbi:YoaK family protein [Paenibacillus xanthanilyticus]|uniref:YoaK family protein n=1 Tax=Paenibacillus xanthanilyticus TaxID=1783531 RepID=A0ABV8K3X6_9BACL
MGFIRRGKGKLRLSYLPSNSIYFGVLLTLIGGFLDAYAFVTRGGVFANVQTGNFVLFGVDLIEGKGYEAFRHIPPILAFVLGVLTAEMLKHQKELRVIGLSGRIIILAEMLLFTLIGLIPSDVSDVAIAVTVILSFAASLQYSYFRRISNFVYSNTMITGDLFTATKSIYHSVKKQDKEATAQFKHFMIIIAAFVAGVLIGAYLIQLFGSRAIWFVSILLLMMAVVYRSSSQV